MSVDLKTDKSDLSKIDHLGQTEQANYPEKAGGHNGDASLFDHAEFERLTSHERLPNAGKLLGGVLPSTSNRDPLLGVLENSIRQLATASEEELEMLRPIKDFMEMQLSGLTGLDIKLPEDVESVHIIANQVADIIGESRDLTEATEKIRDYFLSLINQEASSEVEQKEQPQYSPAEQEYVDAHNALKEAAPKEFDTATRKFSDLKKTDGAKQASEANKKLHETAPEELRQHEIAAAELQAKNPELFLAYEESHLGTDVLDPKIEFEHYGKYFAEHGLEKEWKNFMSAKVALENAAPAEYTDYHNKRRLESTTTESREYKRALVNLINKAPDEYVRYRTAAANTKSERYERSSIKPSGTEEVQPSQTEPVAEEPSPTDAVAPTTAEVEQEDQGSKDMLHILELAAEGRRPTLEERENLKSAHEEFTHRDVVTPEVAQYYRANRERIRENLQKGANEKLGMFAPTIRLSDDPKEGIKQLYDYAKKAEEMGFAD
ncbi:hypothetical protein KKA47_01555 [bacterium]|nr:hypothetical protein [bacterium]